MNESRPISPIIPLLALVLAVALVLPAAAIDSDGDSEEVAAPSITVEEAAKIHLTSILRADFENWQKCYGKQVTLAPGHEFLKPEYGLVAEGKRGEAATVESAKLIAAAKKKPKKMPEERAKKLLENLTIEVMETQPGDFATEPSDPVDTPDGKLHFQILPGDKLIKVLPKKHGDFLLFQFRAIGGEWKVVAEYLD